MTKAEELFNLIDGVEYTSTTYFKYLNSNFLRKNFPNILVITGHSDDIVSITGFVDDEYYTEKLLIVYYRKTNKIEIIPENEFPYDLIKSEWSPPFEIIGLISSSFGKDANYAWYFDYENKTSDNSTFIKPFDVKEDRDLFSRSLIIDFSKILKSGVDKE